jgi:hypothetical protein
MPRLLLLIPTTTYRAQDFLDAAARLAVEVVVGTDRRQALESEAPGRTLLLDFDRVEGAVSDVARFHAARPLDAIVGADEETVVLAAAASAALGLRHNPPEALRTTRDKHALRLRMREAGIKVPAFRLLSADEPLGDAPMEVSYPCVLKPLVLSASRGVIRADDPRSFEDAFRRIARILDDPDVVRRAAEGRRGILVEDYIPGDEVALEGLLEACGRLRVPAPAPLEPSAAGARRPR